MNRTGYQLLGFVVWKGGTWYVRRQYGWLIPSRRVAIGGLVGAAIVGTAVMSGGRRSRA